MTKRYVLSRSLWTTVCQTKTRGPVVALSGLEALRMEVALHPHHEVARALPGYANYMQRVRSRIVPGVW
jgi:hypothetical protein